MKKIVIVFALVVCVCVLTGCTNQNVVGNRVTSGSDIQTFQYAYINVGENVVEGYVTQWRDYTDSDTVQVMLSDGRTYLTHYTNVVLIADSRLGAVGYDIGLNDYN